LLQLSTLVDHRADPIPADLDVSHRVTTRVGQGPTDDLVTEIVVLRGDLEGELSAVFLLAPRGSLRPIARVRNGDEQSESRNGAGNRPGRSHPAFRAPRS